MITAMLMMRVLPGKKKAAMDILRSLLGPLRMKKELLLCKIFVTVEEEEILYLEQWRTEEALQRHIQSDLFLRILEAMEMAASSPQLSFQEVSKVQGINLVIALRNCPH